MWVLLGRGSQPRKRAAQHRKAGKKGRMKVEGRSKTRRAAKAWERNSLDRYRRNHNGRNPPYNKTWDG